MYCSYIVLLAVFSVLSSRNYNPVERRNKGGKKSSKSMQTNANNQGSGGGLSPNGNFGWLLEFYDPKNPVC